MRVPIPQPEPGPWQIDEDGRRYRMFADVKEYEKEINGIPESQFFKVKEAERQRKEAQREAELQKAREQAAQRRACPFRSGINSDCTREACALFVNNGCALARITGNAAGDTVGKRCPISNRSCVCDCALYKKGCALTGLDQVKGVLLSK